MIGFVRRLLCISMQPPILGVQSANTQSPTKQAENIALVNLTVIDGEGGPPKPGMALVTSVAPRCGYVRPREQDTASPCQGHGLEQSLRHSGIDSHYHFMLVLRNKEAKEALRRFAFLGAFTTVRDLAGKAIALAELALGPHFVKLVMSEVKQEGFATISVQRGGLFQSYWLRSLLRP